MQRDGRDAGRAVTPSVLEILDGIIESARDESLPRRLRREKTTCLGEYTPALIAEVRRCWSRIEALEAQLAALRRHT